MATTTEKATEKRSGRTEPSVLELLSWVKEDRVEFVNMQFTDVMGIVKNVTMPKAELEEALTNGVWFDGSSIEGFTRIAESDMFLMPDRATYSVIPWEKVRTSSALAPARSRTAFTAATTPSDWS